MEQRHQWSWIVTKSSKRVHIRKVLQMHFTPHTAQVLRWMNTRFELHFELSNSLLDGADISFFLSQRIRCSRPKLVTTIAILFSFFFKHKKKEIKTIQINHIAQDSLFSLLIKFFKINVLAADKGPTAQSSLTAAHPKTADKRHVGANQTEKLWTSRLDL